MPKYLVEMHDGRKFQVEADSQPSEAEVLAHLGESPTSPTTPAPSVVTPRGNPETRMDTNAIGVNHDWIANRASQLPEPLRYPAAFAGSLLSHTLESLSAPESIATMGVGRLADPTAPLPNRAPTPIRNAIRAAGTELRQAPGAGFVAKTAGALMERVPFPKTFQDLPLAQQMEHLPTEGPAPITGRLSMPIGAQTGINDLPLAEQMRMLPSHGPTPIGRVGMPPVIEQTPFHELPLAQQVDRLPNSGVMPVGRTNIPPTLEQTPFHQLPVYKQMEQLPASGPAPISTRSGGPPITGHLRPAPLSDLELARQEVAAGRLPQSVVDRLEQTAGSGSATPTAAPTPVSVPAPAGPTAQPPLRARVPTSGVDRSIWPPASDAPWSSGADTGSAEARSMSGLHRDEGVLRSRMQYMLDNPRGAIDPTLLAALAGGTAIGPAVRAKLLELMRSHQPTTGTP
jgi:hypothetical protein